jgi:branched-chain amino acid transport system permease protein
MIEALQQMVDALSVGSTYALLALGLTLVFSIMGLINFAYGDIIMWCGYILSLFATASAQNWLFMILVTFFAAILSIAMGYIAFRPFQGAPPITLLLTSFGVSLILQAAAILIFGEGPRVVLTPEILGRVIEIGAIRMPILQLVTLLVAIFVITGLYLLLHRTDLGLKLLATAENGTMARLLAIRSGRVIISAFAISGVIAGIVAVLWLAQIGNVTPRSGLTPTLNAFIAIILGGIGSIRGAVIGGLALGALESLLIALLPGDLLSYRAAIAFGIVIIILLLRPQGIAGRTVTISK